MNHPDPDELRIWARGGIAGAAGDAISSHVDACSECRRTIDDEARLDRVLRIDAPPAVSETAVAAAVGRIDELLNRNRHAARRRIRAVAYAVAAVAAIVAAIVTTPARPPPRFESTLPGVPRDAELQTAAQLAGLRALADHPWVADDLDTVIELQRLANGEDDDHVAGS